MTSKELADKINGIEYTGYEIFHEFAEDAKANGLVIVYGASDDLMEFEGALEDEGGCFDGGKVYLDSNGVSQDDTERNYFINALWCKGKDENGVDATWAYETTIPHETFKVYEAGELYCIGLVFSIEEIFR